MRYLVVRLSIEYIVASDKEEPFLQLTHPFPVQFQQTLVRANVLSPTPSPVFQCSSSWKSTKSPILTRAQSLNTYISSKPIRRNVGLAAKAKKAREPVKSVAR